MTIVTDSELIHYVKDLENKASNIRGQIVLHKLRRLGIIPEVQEWRLPHIRNIVVNFLPDPGIKKMVFTAHYDKYSISPGANDNASGVSVMLGFCRELIGSQLPVRVIFFDKEEAWLRTKVLNLGLLGSLYYVLRNDLKDIDSVYNIELCGYGEFLGVWPIKENQKQLEVVRSVEKAAEELRISYKTLHIPWLLLSSDHLSFRLRGFRNAVTLSFISKAQASSLAAILNKVRIRHVICGKKPELPEPLKFRHMVLDDSRHVNGSSLTLMLSLLLKLVKHKYG